jgi:tetrapyrrole methylase family protein / MazG family protein
LSSDETPPTNDVSTDDLLALTARLHAPAPEGCPWCLEQTPETLAEELVKESHEVLEAASRADQPGLQEELGDVLFLIVTQAYLAQDARQFNLADVMRSVHEKIVRRHPHIFGDVTASTSEEVLRNWQALKRDERPADASILDGIPSSLPALTRAEEIQARAARVGFEWDDVSGVVDKIHEEVDELRAANPGAEQEEEFGDLLLALVNLSRWLGFSPERALQRANDKFTRRFAYIEAACRERGVKPEDLSLEVLDGYWNEAKAKERSSEPQ